MPLSRSLAGVSFLLALGGCVANSSNPVVSVASASLDDSTATIVLALANPGGRDLVLDRIDYRLDHGEIGFPVARGDWTGRLDLPAGGRAELPLVIPFEQPPIEEGSGRIHLTGELHHVDRTGFLGMRSMDLATTSFRLDAEAKRVAP